MKLSVIRVLSAILLAGSLFVLPVVSGEENSARDLKSHVRALTEVAPRLAGTQAEELTANYIENEFESYGLSVRVDNFKLENAFVYRETQLATLSPEKESLGFSLLIRSPPTGGVLTDNLVYFESFPENLPPLEENIVLVESRNFREIMEASPRAIIAYKEHMPAWSNVWPSNSLNSPVFTISFETAEDLIELQEESRVTVKVELESSIEDRTSHNVVATLPGESSETIIVSVHHDSVMTPGAVDDASGVSVMLEVARELSDEELQRTVKFVSFGAEEYGLVGSRHYVENFGESEVSGVLNIDSICSGPPEGLRVGLEGGSGKDSTPWLGEYVRQVAENMGLEPSYGTLNEYRFYGDYLSFVEEGIPATWVYWRCDQKNKNFYPLHTLSDNLDFISENRLEQTSQLTIRSVRELSGEDLEDWVWDYRFPRRFSVFTILTSLVIVLSMVGVGYSRYVQGNKQKSLILKAILFASVAIFTLYLFLLSGLVQVF